MDEMCEIKNEKRILDAIDQLRRRKARPDVDRICNYMMRKFLIEPAETVADLERLVEADVVIKVEYKGNISYRNAAKWSRYALYKTRPESSSILTLNSERMSALVAAALTELSSRDSYSSTGVSYHEIETYLQRKDAPFSKKFLDSMILRELRAGNILRLENGNFVLTAAGKDRSASPDDIKDVDEVEQENGKEIEEKPRVEESEGVNSSNKTVPKSNLVNGKNVEGHNTSASESGAVTVSGFRIGVRRKRAKIVFDPSDHRAPAPRKRGRPAGSSNKNSHHQHHNSVHVHHGNNSSNNHSHISSSSNSSNSSTNGTHGHGGVHLGGSGRHQLDLKDQVFRAHRVPAPPLSQASNDSKRSAIPFTSEGHCFVCGQGPNYRGSSERLIDCRDCITNKVHPRCLEQFNNGVASSPNRDSPNRIIRQNNIESWQCIDCRSCCICEGVSDLNSIISCDGCEEWYHIYCHTPALSERPRGGKWFCHHCAQDRAYAQSVNGVGGLPTPRESPIPEGNSHSSAENGLCENGTSDIDADNKPCLENGEGESKNSLINVKQKVAPDASNWAPIDVELYFRSVGFAEQAHVFKEQEVDGKSLLLMKRSDVLTGLGLKLGPALKMYTHVRRLQLRQHDDMVSSDFVWT
ncbi:uncharacterized protein LOC124172233 [Ischnura elegans]|uniref:uncharacterized protein LOC124172233 n=1 Tax=Ischnura elegans TaxID=197161 RepID=UPI001ED8BA15|nr:uncharacterized protein LOC124172233 [Ischnura elegans]